MSLKKAEFKGSDSVRRLQRIQELCTLSDSKLDGVLIIGGVDSLYSQISQAALKYLFLGSTGQELLGEQVLSQENECLEDVILLIGRQHVAIYYSSESDAAMKILPVISKWRHVTEYVVHDNIEVDEQEERKICAFKNMMMGIKCVGVPFGVDQHGINSQDTMLFEKWPLVQSYGYEGGDSSGKGFVTMNHQVVNITQEMMQVMAHHDTFSAKRLVQESQPFLAYHFDAFLQKLDHAESPTVRDAKSECDLGEELLSSYEFGTMQHGTRELKFAPSRGSRVLFGARTSVQTENSSPEAFLANSGIEPGVPATHMVVQAEDPLTGVRFTRTYFLSSGKVCNQIVDEDSLLVSSRQFNEDALKNAADTKTLIDLYALLVKGFKTGAAQLICECMSDHVVSLDQCLESARADAIHTMKQQDKDDSQMLGSQKLPIHFLDDHLHVKAELMDARGQSIDSLNEEWCLLYCSMTLANIPSNAASLLSVGSLAIGDTFLFRGRDSCSVSALATNRVLNVTKNFARFRSWVQSGEEAEAIEVVMRTLQSEFILQSQSVRLGKELFAPGSDLKEVGESPSMLIKATLLFNSELLPLVHGNWRVFTGGFVFTCPNFNPLIVSIERSVESFSFVSSPNDDLVLLKVVLKQDEYSHSTPLANAIPIPFNTNEIYIPLQSGSRFQNEVFQALESWKDTTAALNIPIHRASDSNKQLQEDTVRDREEAGFDIPSQIKATCEMLVSNQTFEDQDARTIDAFFPQDFISKDPSVDTTLSLQNAEDSNRLNISTTIMIGIPGSRVHALSELICKITSSNYAWLSVCVDLRDLNRSQQQKMEAFGYSVISDKITQALDQIKESAQTLRLPRRILISVTGYVDPITVACAVRCGAHNASLTSKIGAMITCVSAVNMYKPDPLATQEPFPKVFDQMAAGFVTHSIVTNSSNVSAAALQRLRYRMEQVNPFADVMVLSQDVFEGPLTSFLAVDQFESANYKQYRSIHFQGWENTCASDSAIPLCTQYVAEMNHAHSPVTLCFEIAPGIDRSKFLRIITKTLTPFATMAKSMNQIYPSENKKMVKGIRIAQAIAIGKVRQDVTFSSAKSCSKGGVLDGQSRSCWCVEGQIVFNDEPNCVYEYLSTGTLARLWIDPNHSKAANLSSMKLRITGLGLNADNLRQLLLGCYDHADLSLNESRSKSSISMDEKREIQRQHATDPLPEGYLFDGTNYVDFFGNQYEFHPCIAQFIDEYITAANDARKATELKAFEELEHQQCLVRQLD